MTLLCHCGNTTSLGKKLPYSSPAALDGHCLLCRCDEHTWAAHFSRDTSTSDTLPGCGPLCAHRPRKAAVRLAEDLMSRDIPPALAAFYRKLELEHLQEYRYV